MIVWEFPRKLNEKEIEEKAAMLAAMSQEVLPEGANSELLSQLVSQIGPLKAKYVDPTKDYCMSASVKIYCCNVLNFPCRHAHSSSRSGLSTSWSWKHAY